MSSSKPNETPASAPAAPSLVFVENSTARPGLHGGRPICMFVRPDGAKESDAPKMLPLAPGLNVLSPAALAQLKLDTCPVDGLRVVEPLSLPTHIAVDVATNSANRQAVIAWQAIETREPVLKAIAARLAVKGPRAPQD